MYNELKCSYPLSVILVALLALDLCSDASSISSSASSLPNDERDSMFSSDEIEWSSEYELTGSSTSFWSSSSCAWLNC